MSTMEPASTSTKMNASLENGWEDTLNADLRRLVLEHADRTVHYSCWGGLELPPALVPPENMEYYKATLVERGGELPQEPITFEVDTQRILEFARERHGILGPLTVRFGDVLDYDWWGFRDDGEHDHDDEGTLNLDPELIGPFVEDRREWTGITRVRLVPQARPRPAPQASAAGAQGPQAGASAGLYDILYKIELVRDGVHGHQRMVITLPRPHYIDSDTDPDTGTFIEDMEEKLHLRFAVVENDVYEFSV
jgi:hypothetical protein